MNIFPPRSAITARSLLLAALGLAGCQSVQHPPLAQVASVDLARFMGDWYVIANIPTFIEKDAYNAVESYRLAADGSIATTSPFAPADSTARSSATRRAASCSTAPRMRCGACSSSGP